MNEREAAADAILTALEALVSHPAYCKSHWPLAQPGDTYKDAGQPCTMPHAHKIGVKRAWALYQQMVTWADMYVGDS